MTERQNELNQMIETAKAGYEAVEPNLIELGRAYTCQMPDDVRESLQRRGKSSLYIPATPSIALKIYTSIITTYFSNPDIATITADDSNDPLATEAAEAIQESIRYYERHKILNLFPVLSREILNACVYLGCAVKVYWDGTAPRIDGIKLRDLWFDPTSTSIRDAQYLVHRMYIPRHRAEELSKMEGFKKGGDPDALQASTENSGWNQKQPEQYQLVEIYDVYERESDTPTGWKLSTVLNGNIMRDSFPLKDGLPIFFGRLLPQLTLPDEYDSVEMYGSSPIEYILPLQAEMNQLRNQQLDATRMQLEPRYLFAKGAGINPFTFYTNKIHLVNDVNGAKELNAPNIGQAQAQVGQLQLEFQDVSAVTPYNTGTTGDVGNQTATGTAILTQEANQRLNVYTHSLNETLIEPAMNHLAKLVWRYGDTRFLRSAQLGRGVDPDLFVHVNTGLGATSPMIKQQQIQQAMGILGQLGEGEGVKKLAKQLLELLGIKNVQEYITEENINEQELIAPDSNSTPAGDIPSGAYEGRTPAGAPLQDPYINAGMAGADGGDEAGSTGFI